MCRQPALRGRQSHHGQLGAPCPAQQQRHCGGVGGAPRHCWPQTDGALPTAAAVDAAIAAAAAAAAAAPLPRIAVCGCAGGGLSSSAAIVCSSALAVMQAHGVELTKGVRVPGGGVEGAHHSTPAAAACSPLTAAAAVAAPAVAAA